MTSRLGCLSPGRFRGLLLVASLLLPVLAMPGVFLAPASRIPCEVSDAECLGGDTTLAVSVLGRAFARWERGDFRPVDDRVFAPYADTWALGETYTLPALLAYPVAHLSGSPELAYNAVHLLALVMAPLAAGALFSRLAGPGWPALLGALLFAWGPGRLNNLGVLMILWAGLVPLALAFGLDTLRHASWRHGLFFALTWIAIGLGSLYGLLMGSLFTGLALLLFALPDRVRRPRLLVLAGAGAAAAVLLALWLRPYFHLAKELGVAVDPRTLEGQSGEVLSLLNHGAWGGPVKTLLAKLFPFFPGGSAALFPTLTVCLAVCLLRRARARLPERRAWPWLVLAGVSFLFAMGPTVRLAGRALFPGPWRLLAPLPVFRSVRGLFRWDQWWDLALAAVAVIALARALRALPPRKGRALLLAAGALVALDIWPRPLRATPLPPPSPFTGLYRSLPASTVVAVYPFTRATAERCWIEQLTHGRRVLIGFQTFAPPITAWLYREASARSPREVFALYREAGARAVEVRPADLDAARREEVLRLASEPATRALRRGDRLLFLLEPREPILVDPLALRGLVFRGDRAEVPGRPGRLSFRLRGDRVPVTVRLGGEAYHDVLSLPVVGVGALPATLGRPLQPGATVVDAGTGRELGRAAEDSGQ